MSNLISYVCESGAKVDLSPEIVKKYLVNGQGGVTDHEVEMFIRLCQYQKLNPFLREAYLIKYGDKNPATLITGKEVFVKRAMRSPVFEGMEAGIVILREDGSFEYRPGALIMPSERLIGGWAKVYKKGYQRPISASASINEYAQKRYITEKKQYEFTGNWASKPATMIRKVALVQALREAFPEDFSGLYSVEEMPVDGDALPTAEVNLLETKPDTAQAGPPAAKPGKPENPPTQPKQQKPVKPAQQPKQQKQNGQAAPPEKNQRHYEDGQGPMYDTEGGELMDDYEPDYESEYHTDDMDRAYQQMQHDIAADGPPPLICEECGAKVTEKVAAYSQKKYDRTMCYNCQKGWSVA